MAVAVLIEVMKWVRFSLVLGWLLQALYKLSDHGVTSQA